MWTKTKELLLALLVATGTSLAPIKAVLIAVFSLVFIDWVAGVYRSVVVKKEAFTSLKWRDTLIKLAPYLCAILGGFQVDKVAGFEADGSLYFTRAFALCVMGIEVQSLGENVGFDLIKLLREKLTPAPKDK